MARIVAWHASLTLGERARGCRDRLGNAVQTDGQLGDDAERSLGADEQPRQVVAGGGFFCARRGVDDLAVAAHHLQRHDVVAHGAVAHRIGARRARRRHAADRGIGAGIDRKEQPLVAQLLVQQLAGDAGLDDAVEIFGMHGEQPVHVARVDADAAGGRVHLALQRGAGAVGDHRHLSRGADAHHVLDIRGLLHEHHAVRRLPWQPRRRLRVLVAHRLRGDKAIAEARGQRLERAAQRLRIHPRQVGGQLCQSASLTCFDCTVANDV